MKIKDEKILKFSKELWFILVVLGCIFAFYKPLVIGDRGILYFSIPLIIVMSVLLLLGKIYVGTEYFSQRKSEVKFLQRLMFYTASISAGILGAVGLMGNSEQKAVLITVACAWLLAGANGLLLGPQTARLEENT
ncbi:hypothetical protein [Kocuria marina]|uniref:hypothetical protein n=1 Tax=Kocuria marina TaxID=223184 RepID=UPI0011A09A17|nr:hypothetical protein [Kocuria indica]